MWQNARGVHRTPKTAKLQGPRLIEVPASLLLYSPECVEGAFSEVRIRHRAYLCSEKLEGLLHASVRTEPRPQRVGACIRICPIEQCAGQSPTPLRCVYATSRRLITPSESSRTVKDGAVVVIGVDRRGVGCDNGPAGSTSRPRRRLFSEVRTRLWSVASCSWWKGWLPARRKCVCKENIPCPHKKTKLSSAASSRKRGSSATWPPWTSSWSPTTSSTKSLMGD